LGAVIASADLYLVLYFPFLSETNQQAVSNNARFTSIGALVWKTASTAAIAPSRIETASLSSANGASEFIICFANSIIEQHAVLYLQMQRVV
jgi:hypothetical protein